MSTSDGIRRIGRAATPIERGLQLTVEDPSFLDELAFNLFESEHEMAPTEIRRAWEMMSDGDRERWVSEVMEAFQCEIRNQSPDPTPDPGGSGPGLPLPDEMSADIKVA